LGIRAASRPAGAAQWLLPVALGICIAVLLRSWQDAQPSRIPAAPAAGPPVAATPPVVAAAPPRHAVAGRAKPRAPARRARPVRVLPSGNLRRDQEAVLPQYRASFEESARRAGLDWRLLAAVGYQESRWNPAAQSPTGVRGLMMLTQDTALDLGVDREDAAQSILGAGRLLRDLYAQLPPRIHEPDRTAMALAAYNQGLGHLLDARDLADLRGGNPDRWDDVRQALPLLERQEWIATTKYGYARGSEAVDFVERVSGYYAALKEGRKRA
jgi:membrane-bound lytic murein transglycosylase F